MEIYLEVRRAVKLWERALQNGLWLAGAQCEAKSTLIRPGGAS
jgi:hypothetical protein